MDQFRYFTEYPLVFDFSNCLQLYKCTDRYTFQVISACLLSLGIRNAISLLHSARLYQALYLQNLEPFVQFPLCTLCNIFHREHQVKCTKNTTTKKPARIHPIKKMPNLRQRPKVQIQITRSYE